MKQIVFDTDRCLRETVLDTHRTIRTRQEKLFYSTESTESLETRLRCQWYFLLWWRWYCRCFSRKAVLRILVLGDKIKLQSVLLVIGSTLNSSLQNQKIICTAHGRLHSKFLF